MDLFFYVIARGLFALINVLPLTMVARLGRAGGGLFYLLDARHRRVALENLQGVYGKEKSPAILEALARENFRRIGENFICAAKTAMMDNEALRKHMEFAGLEKLPRDVSGNLARSVMVAIGHFGNFELYARGNLVMPGIQAATTYRGLDHPRLDRLMQSLRERSGCRYFERRWDALVLRNALQQERLMLGLLVDQHAGRRGLPIPFFGRIASTSAAPAVLALRYHCPLFSAICYRIGLARWRIEVGDEIPTQEDGHPRPVEAITLEINRAFETAIHRDPANWFWVHRRWKWDVNKPHHRKPRTEATVAAEED
jgi:KDO2-lipid IV(A) lauroyltransferase